MSRVPILIVLSVQLLACSKPQGPTPSAAPVTGPPAAPAPSRTPPPVPVISEPPPEPWETEKDPVRARTMKLETAWRLDPQYTHMELRFLDLRPALVAMEVGSDGTTPDEQGERIGKSLDLLAHLVRDFLRGADLDPPALSQMGDHRIRVMVFRSRASFDAWHARPGASPTGSSYYSPREQVIRMWANGDSEKECFQLGTYALRHAYARYFVEEDDRTLASRQGVKADPVDWTDPRLVSAFAWFERGLAKYFGDFAVVRDSVVDLDGRADLAQFQFCRSLKRVWGLDDILLADAGQIRARSAVKAGGEGMGEEWEQAAWTQGHLLVRYFLDGENGRWRTAFLRLVHDEFSGVSATPYLLRAFGLLDEAGRPLRPGDPKVRAWIAEVEKGWNAWADGLFKNPR